MRKRVLIVFPIVAVALLISSVYVAVNVGKIRETTEWGATIIVEELSEKPEVYFVLENPDSYVLEAISNLKQPVYLNFFNKTQIDEMIEANGTNNIEYNNHYYSVGLLFADPGPAMGGEFVFVSVLAWMLWGLAGFIVLIAYRKGSQRELG
jgi:hypothetical protein